jgi:hypothetical protein
MLVLTRAEFEVLAAWRDTDPLPPTPFKAAPWLAVTTGSASC